MSEGNVPFSAMDENIRETARWLTKRGFTPRVATAKTVDSHDAVTHHVNIEIAVAPELLVTEARRLFDLLEMGGLDLRRRMDEDRPAVVATYDPTRSNLGIITLCNVDDSVILQLKKE
jgi:hypothetical protein